MDTNRNKTSPLTWVLLAAFLITSCCLVFAGYQLFRNGLLANPLAQATPTAVGCTDCGSAPEPTQVPAASIPSCISWAANQTKNLLPGQAALGDVKVNGVRFYDSGSGEGTIVVNTGTKPVSVYAQWGAGCLKSTDTDLLVSGEFETGCNGNGCSSVRLVTCNNTGCTEQFFK